MIKSEERAIGRKEIIWHFETRWGITTWWGVKRCCKSCNIPIRKTPSGKPMIFVIDLIRYEQKLLKIITT